MLKKALSLLLALIMALAVLPAGPAARAEEAPAPSPNDEAPARRVINEEDLLLSDYVFCLEPMGKDYADFYSLVLSVLDAEGNTIYYYDAATIGEVDQWEAKKLYANFEGEPATIRIESMYMLLVDGYMYEQLTYEAPFPEWCSREPAVGVSFANNPGQEIPFCLYSVEDLNGPLHYCDGDGNPCVQEEYTLFTGGFDLETPGGWYALRGNWNLEALVAYGDCHLVLCDDSSVYFGTGITIVPGSSLTIWPQTEGNGRVTVMQRYGSTIEICGPGIDVPEGASLTINGGRYLIYGGYDDAAIGSCSGTNSGSITINGNHTYIEARADACKIGGEWYGLECGAAIGGGDDGTSGPITINGGVIKAYGGRESAGIGGGNGAPNGPIIINGGEIYAEGGSYGGAGIGAGNDSSNGPITINGGVVEAHYGEADILCGGAGIGAGEHAHQNGAITINGGEVYAYAASGAGIGGGGCDSGDGGGYDGKDVIITDGCVVAVSNIGAGIGGGGAREGGGGGDGGNVRIDGGIVLALSTSKGAGIGGGNDGDGGTVTINGGSVTALGGYLDYNYWKAGLADFAPSFNEFLNYASVVNYLLAGLIFSGTYGGAGIGGGDDGYGGTVVINGGTVIATAGRNSAHSIGKGDGGGGSGSLWVYDIAKTTYGHLDSSGNVVEDGVCYGNEASSICRSKSFAAIVPGPCIVTFDMQGHGMAPAQQTVESGGTVTEPEEPSAEGWYFGGWYTDTSFQTEYDFSTPVSMLSLTLYALWLKKYPMTLTKQWPDSSHPASVTVDYVNEYAPGRVETGSVTLSSANGWAAGIFVTDTGSLTLSEGAVEGYAPESWVLSDSSGSVELPFGLRSSGRLWLGSEQDSGLSSYSYSQAIDILHRGEARIKLTNSHSTLFSVSKEWNVDHYGNYMPESIQAVLQRSYFSDWTTVDTVVLSEENGWQADFAPIVEGNFYYRVRELDQYGNAVLAANDSDNPYGVAQTASLHVDFSSGGGMDIDYTVDYSEQEGGLTVITNSCGTVYTMSCEWQDEYGAPLPADETPDMVTGLLLVRGSSRTAAMVRMKAENGWFEAFEPQMDEADYYARVSFQELNSGYTVVYDGSDGIEGCLNRGTFAVTKDGASRYYDFVITYSYDEATRHTAVTLKRFGPRFMVHVDFEPDRGLIYSVYALLQHRTYDVQGNEVWTTLQTVYVPANHAYDEVFEAVPVTDETPLDSYRIREAISAYHDFYGSGFVIDPDDPDMTELDGSGSLGRLLLDPDDADNASYPGLKPIFTYVHLPDSSGEWTGTYVVSSCYLDETTLTARITNTRLDQYEYGEPEWEWNADCTEAAAVFTALSDPAVKPRVTASGEAITSEAVSEPGCETEGVTVYTATVTFNGVEYVGTNTVTEEALGHIWGEATYEWSADHSSCTAAHTCLRDENHTEAETAAASCEVIVPPTATEPGLALYTAEFGSEGFETQTVEVVLPPVGEPLPGDVDCNGVVDLGDVSLLSMFLNGENPEISASGLQAADANGDGTVDIRDIAAIYAMIANS